MRPRSKPGNAARTRLGGVFTVRGRKPILTAITVYPGAGPESVDQQLSLPITQVVSGLLGVQSTTSTSSASAGR